jgi:SAM-dependent methyltransferase
VEVCPVCGAPGQKPALLTAESAIRRGVLLTLVRCPDCGSAFYDDRTPARYEDHHGLGPIKFHVEQGAGVDSILAPLFCFRPERVRRYLEVGCGFGYSLDFARYAFGWQVRGIDPSSVAAAGREALQLDIVPAYLSLDTDAAEPAFDLILCSELIEHLADPHALLQAIGWKLTPDGALILTTPNAAAISTETPAAALWNTLAPGSHLVVFSRASLERVLKANGFTHVHVWEHLHTLRAVASRDASLVLQAPVVDRPLYRRYLDARSATTSVETPLGLGFAYRLFKECVNTGDFPAAEPVFARLSAAYRATYGVDLGAPDSIALAPERSPDFDRFAARHAFNLTGVLYFRGITELNHRGSPQAALPYFRAAARAGVVIRTALRGIGADDGETEDLVAQARIHAVYCLAHADPAGALAELEGLGALRPGDPPRELWLVPAAPLAAARAEVFVRLVNSGHYAEAARIAETVRHALRPPRGKRRGRTVPARPGDRDAVLRGLFCLGILTLNHQGAFKKAARLFGLVHRMARRAHGSGQLGEAAALMEQARFHEALALERARDDTRCEEVGRAIAESRATGLPGLARRVGAAIRALTG